jgi:drug/metabolite transporter (DMT)-like permease
VVAPLAAAAGIVPVVAGIASGERPAPVQIAGIVLLIGGVIVVARTPSTGPAQRIRPLAIWLGLATALCFGSVVVLLGQAGGMGTLWTVLIARITAVACLVAAVPVMVRRGGVGVSRRHMPILVVIGFLDLLANFCMAASASTGLVSIAGPIISLHTVVTILLAAWMLSERLHPVQRFAAAVALAGGALAAI